MSIGGTVTKSRSRNYPQTSAAVHTCAAAFTPTNKGEVSPMRKTIFLLASILFLFASLAPAQTITASITGTATDPSGAAVPNGTVTATNTETNVRTATTTNTEG